MHKSCLTLFLLFPTQLPFLQPSLIQFGTTGLVASASAPVKVSETMTIACSKPGEVTADFRQLTVTCGYDGNFDLPAILPTCKAGLVCPAAPIPSNGTNLVKVAGAGTIYEFQTQVRCYFVLSVMCFKVTALKNAKTNVQPFRLLNFYNTIQCFPGFHLRSQLYIGRGYPPLRSKWSTFVTM